jgi:glycosyltransferase involved in cell wall biosynthesis
MRVLQLISSGGYYGAENMLLNLVSHDAQTIADNLLAVFDNRHQPNTDLYRRALEKGVNAELISCQGRADWRAVREIRRLVRERGIQVMHSHGYKSDIYGYLAARDEGTPLVATCHNWLAGGAALAAYNFLDRMALKRFDAVCAVSPAIAEKLLSLGLRRELVTVIPNGLDAHAFDAEPRAEGEPTHAGVRQIVGIVARLDLQKGFEYLLGAVATLRGSFPGLHLMVVGEGPDRPAIEAMIRRHNLADVITLAGQQTDMPVVYASMDIFVLPSLNEGLPMTLLEAMAARKPVVATRVGAVPTVITDRENGLLIAPADEAGLTHALRQLLADPELCRYLGRNARAHVERNFTSSAMVQKYRTVYEAVLARGRRVCAEQVPEESGVAKKMPAP